MTSIGQRIYELRDSHHLSQGELAEKLDVSRQTISKWENDQSIPELDKLIALSDIFSVTVDYIARGIKREQEDTNNDKTKPFEEKESLPVMIKIDPNKKYTKTFSFALGTIYCLKLIIGFAMSLISSFTVFGIMGSYQHYLALMINIFVVVGLLIGKPKAIVTAFALHFLWNTVQMIRSGVNVLSVLSLLCYSAIILVYFIKGKRASKIFLTLAIALVLGCEGYSMYLGIEGILQITSDITSAISSFVSVNLSNIIDIIVKIGICVVLYYASNPLPCYEVPESEYIKENSVYVNMIKHILLLAFTFGIYNFVWIYKTTQGMNFLYKEYEKDELSKPLLCAFVPFYQIYWFYSQAKRLEVLLDEEKKGSSRFAVATLILAIFFPFFGAAILLQSKLNDYCEREKHLD